MTGGKTLCSFEDGDEDIARDTAQFLPGWGIGADNVTTVD